MREYGFGWSVIRQENGIIVVHGGDWLGYTTGILLDLSTGQTVIQLCNMPSRRLIFSLWDILNGRDTEPPEFVKVTFCVRSAELPDSCSVFITGNHRKLGNWDPGVTRLKNVAPHFWKRTISLEKGSDIEYKITRGDWAREAIFKQGIIPANRVLAVKSDTSIVIEVPYWKDTGGI